MESKLPYIKENTVLLIQVYHHESIVNTEFLYTDESLVL